LALLLALAEHGSEEVRVWAGSVARTELGREGIPVLLKLAQHRRVFTRDSAMQELEGLDPELLEPFIPEMRRIFRRASNLYAEGGAAMWRLARLRDPEAPALFRTYAADKDTRHFDYRMPLVLADYIEDPESVVHRIELHDHDWMPWLARAAAVLDLPGAEQALTASASDLPDADCRASCEEELQTLLQVRAAPPGAAFETAE
jgi:hypothetical protein